MIFCTNILEVYFIRMSINRNMSPACSQQEQQHIKLNLQMRVSWWLILQQAARMFDDAT